MLIIDKIKNIFTNDNDLYCISSLPSVIEFGEIINVKKHQPSWWMISDLGMAQPSLKTASTN